MDALSFAFWLQGYFEMADPHSIDEKGTKLIKEHLSLVFDHIIAARMEATAAAEAECSATEQAAAEETTEIAKDKIPKPKVRPQRPGYLQDDSWMTKRYC